ncbi:MAG TPA: hypothetical protein VFK41_01415 [Nocardioidaceae bacterium]|nr:hypothetical protein [Nocardioidaceae bacterium]
MRATAARFAIVTTALASALLLGGTAQAAPTPGDCNNDSKLIGPILLSTDDAPGTWWRLTKEGFEAGGIHGEAAYKAWIDAAFGTTFGSLEEAVQALVDAVVSLDRNGNGYVCATNVRGTRAFIGDPNWTYYFFGVQDDKHV